MRWISCSRALVMARLDGKGHPLLAGPDRAVHGCRPLLRVPPGPSRHHQHTTGAADPPGLIGLYDDGYEERENMTTVSAANAHAPDVWSRPALLTFPGGVRLGHRQQVPDRE
ncbi:hypothetical protein [Streptomyces sp. NPDC004546]|uniref:hypothetical protein n=1 Tax=Streptomyces sp. NPDC004546 TaxID=3154282 RepID=UPI0033A8DBCD